MKNKDLKELYNNIYREGTKKFFTFDNTEETEGILSMMDWKNKYVVDIGCGDGNLATEISKRGAKNVIGIDYSEEAIKIADKKDSISAQFYCGDYKDCYIPCEIVVMQGLLEHLDNPFEELDWIFEYYNPDVIITSSPSFLNPRGYIWMALQILFDVPMSLTDLHQLNLWEFEEYCRKRGYDLEIKSVDKSWGNGHKMIEDFEKRLKNALSDVGMYNKEKLDKFLKWLEKAIFEHSWNVVCGATMIYKISRNSHEK